MVPNCATAEDLLKAIKDEKVQMIDLRFTDLPGVWQHFCSGEGMTPVVRSPPWTPEETSAFES